MIALIPASFLAGILMFLAPCTLPLVPGYLAFIAGGRNHVIRNALAFILGFSIIFILLGTFAAFFGTLLGSSRFLFSRAAGVIIILFGLTMLHVIHVPVLSGTRRMRIPHILEIGRPESSFLIGALFAFGWSPCIGPILGTILLLASGSGTAPQGAFLLAIFSLGLGLPFFLAAVGIEEVEQHIARLGNTILILERVGGVILILLGILMVLGDMGLLVSWGYGLFGFLGYDRLLNYL